MMSLLELRPASEGWNQSIDVFVLPLSLEQFWEAYWADDAPYFIPAFNKDSRDELISYSDWGMPTHGGEKITKEFVGKQRTIERKVHGSSYLNHDHESEIISLVQHTSTTLIVDTVVAQSGGFMYSSDFVPHVRWEILTDDPRSNQVVVR